MATTAEHKGDSVTPLACEINISERCFVCPGLSAKRETVKQCGRAGERLRNEKADEK
ncbi:hypothetical protein K0M31_011383, partial [Melipona bicolor]